MDYADAGCSAHGRISNLHANMHFWMLVSTAAMPLMSSANGLLSFLIVQLKHIRNLVLGQHGYCPCPFNYNNTDALGDKLFVTLRNESECLLVQKESRSVVHVWYCIHCAGEKHLSRVELDAGCISTGSLISQAASRKQRHCQLSSEVTQQLL